MTLDDELRAALGYGQYDAYELSWSLRMLSAAATARSKRSLAKLTPAERCERQRRWQRDCRARKAAVVLATSSQGVLKW